jgi:hypothetical protein
VSRASNNELPLRKLPCRPFVLAGAGTDRSVRVRGAEGALKDRRMLVKAETGGVMKTGTPSMQRAINQRRENANRLLCWFSHGHRSKGSTGGGPTDANLIHE